MHGRNANTFLQEPPPATDGVGQIWFGTEKNQLPKEERKHYSCHDSRFSVSYIVYGTGSLGVPGTEEADLLLYTCEGEREREREGVPIGMVREGKTLFLFFIKVISI